MGVDLGQGKGGVREHRTVDGEKTVVRMNCIKESVSTNLKKKFRGKKEGQGDMRA